MRKPSPASISFFEQVYEIVMFIPKGRVTSYGAIAKCLGSGKSARMVGWAMNYAHANPKLPAHRVVNRTGMLTGKHHFTPTNAMQKRLEAEGIRIKKDKIVDFKAIFWNPIDEINL